MAATWKRNYTAYQKKFLNILVLYQERSDFKAYFEIILSLVTVAIFAIFAIRPTARTIANLIQENKGKEETIALMDEKIKNLTLASDLYDRNRIHMELLAKSIPTDPEPHLYERQLEAIMQQSEVSVLGLSVGPAVIKGESNSSSSQKSNLSPMPQGAEGVPVNFDITGQYANLVAYLNQLDNILRPLHLDTFSFSNENTKQTGAANLVITVTGQAPYYPGNNPVASPTPTPNTNNNDVQ